MRHNKTLKLCSLGGGTLRPASDLRATEEEGRNVFSKRYRNDGFRPKPQGSLKPDRIAEGHTSNLHIGTWNVRTMMRKGKLENLKREMVKMKLNIVGLSEVRWKGVGDFMSDDVRVIFAGGEESQRGVAVVLDKDTAKRVTKIIQHSDRLVMVKIEAKPVDLVIFQLYMPTSDHEDEEVEELYEALEELIDKEKGKDYVVVMGD